MKRKDHISVCSVVKTFLIKVPWLHISRLYMRALNLINVQFAQLVLLTKGIFKFILILNI